MNDALSIYEYALCALMSLGGVVVGVMVIIASQLKDHEACKPEREQPLLVVKNDTGEEIRISFRGNE